jgi:uncharacterized membrane protein YjgN (DUF898 family)
MESVTPAITSTHTEAAAFRFTGRGGEYFRIWIVNLCLSLITLGIYSAWAKVRRVQYFYRNTSVAGASFDYHGAPIAILKGRLVATVLFAIYSLAGRFSLAAGLAAFALILVVMPYLLVRSFRFRLHNTSYRGLRFAFHGTTGKGYVSFLLLPLAGYLTLGLLGPLAHQRIRRYLHDNSVYGNEHFKLHARAGAFYKPYLVAFGSMISVMLVAVVVSALLIKGGAPEHDAELMKLLPLIIGGTYLGALLFVAPYVSARLQNVIWNNTTLGPYGFVSAVRARGLFGIMFTNFFLIILTLGLYKPFADIRLTRYRIENIALPAGANLEEFAAVQQAEIGATGEEMAGMFDMDIAI